MCEDESYRVIGTHHREGSRNVTLTRQGGFVDLAVSQLRRIGYRRILVRPAGAMSSFPPPAMPQESVKGCLDSAVPKGHGTNAGGTEDGNGVDRGVA
jgi:hypothetical protein